MEKTYKSIGVIALMVFLTFLLFSSIAKAEEGASSTARWAKVYGGAGLDNANAIDQTSDRGYIVAGETDSFGAGEFDAWVLKLGNNGDIEWQKTYGGISSYESYPLGTIIQQTSDGGYILTGAYRHGNVDVVAIKLDTDGNIQWQKTYVTPRSLWSVVYMVPKSLQQTLDGGFIIAGISSGAWNDAFVLKLDADGNIQWLKSYGGSLSDVANSVKQTIDGGYIVAGWTGGGAYVSNGWVVKLDADGNIQWEKGYSAAISLFESIYQTEDGGYIVGGRTTLSSIQGRYYLWVLKLDADGNIQWENIYDDYFALSDIFGGGNGDNIQQTSDRGYIAIAVPEFEAFGVLRLDSKGEIPNCPGISIPPVIVTDTAATVNTPSPTINEAIINPVSTAVTGVDTRALETLVCFYGDFDLVVEEIDVPSSASPQQQIQVSWTVKNWGGSQAQPSWYDMVYLSDDTQLDDTDLYLSEVLHPEPLSTGESYSKTVNVTLPDIALGTYYLLVKTDYYNSLNEPREWNNVLPMLITIVQAGQETGLSEISSRSSILSEDLLVKKATLIGGEVIGDLNGSLSFVNFEMVSIDSGSFAGKGFSKGEWQATLDSVLYRGQWQGVSFLVASERKIYLMGAISGGEASGIMEGYLTESISGSGVFDRYNGVWKLGRLGDKIISATLSISGNLSYLESSSYPSVRIYALQMAVDGTTSGHYIESLSSVVTHFRVSDINNSYNGQGFSIISYVSNLGQGEGWTYDTEVSKDKVEMKGLFSKPLLGIVSGVLDETKTPRTLSLTIERIDTGLPPMADLEVKTWGLTRVSPGQTTNYIIEYRNDWVKSAESVVVVAQLPYQVDYVSSTGGGIYKWETHEVIWKLGTLIPTSKGNLVATVQVQAGLAQGTQLRNFAMIGTTSDEKDVYLVGISAITDILKYLDYKPVYIISHELLSSEEFAQELDDADFADIFDYADELGYEYSNVTGKVVYDNAVQFIYSVMGNDEKLILAIKIKNATQSISLLNSFDDGNTSFFNRVGGVTVNTETNELLHLGKSWLAMQKSCLHNCMQALVPIWGIIQGLNDCRIFLKTHDVDAFETCLQLFVTHYVTLVGNIAWPGVGTLAGPATAGLFCLESCLTHPISYVCEPGKTRESCDAPMPLTFYQVRVDKCVDYYWDFDHYKESCGEICIGPRFQDKPRAGSEAHCGPINTPNIDSYLSSVLTGRDPNIKYGPESFVLPSQKLNYAVEYENEGEGIAFGVYFTDTLDEDLNDSTLEIGQVISTIDGSVIAPVGTYNPSTRTITWLVGEVGSGEGGYANFSVNIRSDAPDGTEIINFGTVYFPSVPETTRTNGIVSIVSLNQPPVADANGPYVGYEGSPITFDASVSYDSDGTIVLYEWDFGDDGIYDVSSTSSQATFTWGDDYTGIITLRVTDNDGLISIDTAEVTVNNVPPTVEAGPDQEVYAGDMVSFSGSFTDPGWFDTHTINWGFGDETETTGTLTPTHVFYNKGTYTVTLTVTDDGGGTGTDTLQVVVKPIPATTDCDPDTLNLNSKGQWITCYIELPLGYDVWKIDGSTILLNGIIPAYLGKEGWAKDKSNESNIKDYDGDGILERMVKFDRVQVQGILTPGEAILTLIGKVGLVDFEGSDTIKVIDKGKG